MEELAISSCERRNEIKMGNDRCSEFDSEELKVPMLDGLNEVGDGIAWEAGVEGRPVGADWRRAVRI